MKTIIDTGESITMLIEPMPNGTARLVMFTCMERIWDTVAPHRAKMAQRARDRKNYELFGRLMDEAHSEYLNMKVAA